MAERLDKILANAMVGSRKEVAKIIRSGRVSVDDMAVTLPDFKVEPKNSKIYINGKPIGYKEHYHIMLNKPKGVITATEDSKEKTVLDLISDDYPKSRLFPAGRLDKDTVGFVLLTTDGTLGHRVTGPKNHVEKVYYVETDKSLSEELIPKFKDGITLDDGYLCRSARLNIFGKNNCHLTISEGKFHQVKRMFLAFSITVTYLKRVKIGGVTLDDTLLSGEYRELSKKEEVLLFE